MSTDDRQSHDDTDAVALLSREHRVVEKLFQAFEHAADVEAKATLARRACQLLTMHTIEEEEHLYPAAEAALGADGDAQVDEARVEHYLVKILIDKIERTEPERRGYDAAVKVLAQMVQRHVEEEEAVLFPRLKKSGCDLAMLGTRIARQREALQKRLDDMGEHAIGDKT